MCDPAIVNKVKLKLKRPNRHSILPHCNVCLETITTHQYVPQLVILGLLAIIPHRPAQRPTEHY